MSRDQDIAKCASAAWFEFRARRRTQGTRTLRQTLDNVHARMMDLQNQVDTLRANLTGAVDALISLTWPKGSSVYDQYKPDYPYINKYLCGRSRGLAAARRSTMVTVRRWLPVSTMTRAVRRAGGSSTSTLSSRCGNTPRPW